ncbi:MAG: hypothetical protein V1819_02905 [bacterium]
MGIGIEEAKKYIEEEIKKAINGQHKCTDPDCLITMATPIAALIKDSSVAIKALIEILYFCFSQRRVIAIEGSVVLSVERTEINGNLTVEKFQKLVGEYEKEAEGEEEIIKKWILLAKETGNNLDSIEALLNFYYLILAILQTLKELAEFKAQKLERDLSIWGKEPRWKYDTSIN